MINIDNFGGCIGTLQNDPIILDNRDGSRKVLMTILCPDLSTGKNKPRTYQRIPVQGFIPKTYKGKSPYAYLHAGDSVHIEYTMKANHHNNQTELICQIDTIKFGKELPDTLEKEPPMPAAAATPKEVPTVEETPDTPADPKYQVDLDLNDDLDL